VPTQRASQAASDHSSEQVQVLVGTNPNRQVEQTAPAHPAGALV
jgi:hypothetical protein